MSNPRNAGRKPSGKIKHNLSIYLDPEDSAILKSKESQAAWIASLIEKQNKTNQVTILVAIIDDRTTNH